MPPFVTRRSARKPRAAWRDLSRGDRKLIGQLLTIAALSLVALLAAGRYAEKVVLESESGLRSTRVVEFLRANLAAHPDLLFSGRPTAGDPVVLRQVLQAGEVFRYRLYDAQGRVVLASRSEDVGRRNPDAEFGEVLQERQSLFRVERRPLAGSFADSLGVPYPEATRVVGKRYAPLTQGPRLLGAIEVDLDMTALQQRLQGNTKWFVAGLLAMFGLVGGACSAAVRRNIQDRRRAMEQLGEARRRAEILAREANRILDNLLASEEDKMSRIVGLVDGISHQIGNPLATVSMHLDGMEASARQLDHGELDSHLTEMRAALDRVAAFLHGLTALSLEDLEIQEDADINEIVQSLVDLVQLNDRTRSIEFSLILRPDIASVSLPRRSVSLALFIVLTVFAESVDRVRGRIEVATAMSAAGDAVELRITAAGPAFSTASSQAASTSRHRSGHLALETARRIVESVRGRMALSEEVSGGRRCELSLPVSSQAAVS